ncbi:hypothetical protein EVAR_69653_1 [Eumeta japonica]|uniref:Uncharacterized protein n=1 Tax=Eumeta variegata TaxID=151549 RepID=A0A4C2A6V7_EUMVA|nr:hypothetical protein EVAR_69653_1 [Eumeta japonica]
MRSSGIRRVRINAGSRADNYARASPAGSGPIRSARPGTGGTLKSLFVNKEQRRSYAGRVVCVALGMLVARRNNISRANIVSSRGALAQMDMTQFVHKYSGSGSAARRGRRADAPRRDCISPTANHASHAPSGCSKSPRH